MSSLRVCTEHTGSREVRLAGLRQHANSPKPRPDARSRRPCSEGAMGHRVAATALLVCLPLSARAQDRSEEHTSELQSHSDLVCRLLLEKKNPGPPGPARGCM